jgi:hypothetical protein
VRRPAEADVVKAALKRTHFKALATKRTWSAELQFSRDVGASAPRTPAETTGNALSKQAG